MSWFQSSSQEDASLSSETSVSNLTYKQRLSMFLGLGAISLGFFFFASMSIVFPTKFAKLFFLGSFFLVSALGFLVGPGTLLSSSFQPDRLPSTLGYILSAIATMVCAVVLESSILTLIALVAQFACAGWLALSFLPFGQKFFGLARNLLPI